MKNRVDQIGTVWSLLESPVWSNKEGEEQDQWCSLDEVVWSSVDKAVEQIGAVLGSIDGALWIEQY